MRVNHFSFLSKLVSELKTFLRHFRPVNLLFIVGIQWLAQRALLIHHNTIESIDFPSDNQLPYPLVILMYSSVLLAGSGYLINDYLNQRSDRINRPNQPISALFKRPFLFWSIYALMNASALFFGHQLDLITQTPKYIWIFFVITTFLGVYSGFKWMKFIIGPLIISSLVALVPLLVLELVSDIQSDFIDQNKFSSLQPWIWRISFLAFWVNALREVVKDIQDINGDKNDRRLTIPIVVGLRRTTKLLVVMGLILIVILGVMVALAKSLNLTLSLNLLACLLLALGLTNQFSKIEQPEKAKSVSLRLKLLLALGAFCLWWL